MPVRNFKPTSPGRRGGSVEDFSGLTKKAPEKALLEPLRSSGGRNAHGRQTCRFRGGGHKRSYRVIDRKRDKDGIPGKVVSIEYDPNRSARIALIQYADGEKRYILAPEGLSAGQTIMNGPDAEPEVGNCMALADMPLGTEIHNVELRPGCGGAIARSAGNSARLMAREGDYAQVVMPSGEVRLIHIRCRATIGQVGNTDHRLVSLGKAGRKRWLGRRPHSRGMAMNPVDHPMGGGKKRSKGHLSQSPTGVLAKGGKTRRAHSVSSPFIVRGRKRKKQ